MWSIAYKLISCQLQSESTMELELSLKLCKTLCDFKNLTRVVYYASDRPGWLSRYFFGGRLAQLVYKAKVDYHQTLTELFEDDQSFWCLLESGRTLGFEAKVVPWLDFSSPGRVVSSLSLLAYLVDHLDCHTDFSKDYNLEVICAPVCCRLKTLVEIQKLKFRQEETMREALQEDQESEDTLLME